MVFPPIVAVRVPLRAASPVVTRFIWTGLAEVPMLELELRVPWMMSVPVPMMVVVMMVCARFGEGRDQACR